MMRPLLSILLMPLLFSTPALPNEQVQVLADRFVLLLGYENQFVKFHEQCLGMQRSAGPEATVSQSPAYFGGINPGDKKWPAVTSAYAQYFQDICSHPTKVEFLRAISSSYAQSLTSAQFQKALEFYSSATGSALISAHREAATAAYEVWTVANKRFLPSAIVKLQEEIKHIEESE